jgi:beta-galactosidase
VALTASAAAALPLSGCRTEAKGAAGRVQATTVSGAKTIRLDHNWLFGGEFEAAMSGAEFDDSKFERVTIPHCPMKLSWQNWNWHDWQKVWGYRRRFNMPSDLGGKRVMLKFEGVMVGAEPFVNGKALPKHLGGYLPFEYEITDIVRPGENILALAVDGKWSDVPPQGSPKGPPRVDYLEVPGIHRSARIEIVPNVFISDVYAKPQNVLQPNRTLQTICSVDAAKTPAGRLEVLVQLKDGTKVLAEGRKTLSVESAGKSQATVEMTGLESVKLWDVDAPVLYEVVTTLLLEGQPIHSYLVRTGFREAKFTNDGFFLNGKRLQIFGLNRHEIYPYVGYGMPARVKRHDATILKKDFNCNFVRCSHYPQSSEFLDACDELGLLVWQEVPGWGYLGDDAWKELLIRDVRTMIIRDRSRPSIVVWGTRVNESATDVPLYAKTRALAKELDETRPSSGTMTTLKTFKTEWAEDVFAYDDYHAEADGSVGVVDPLPEVPFLLSEGVGQFNYTDRKNFNSYYRRSGDPRVQRLQAVRHAQGHSRTFQKNRIAGLVAWCAFEYGSDVNGYKSVKYPGVSDVFRLPKLGAAFYLSQGDPKTKPVIEPDFYWDFGPATPRGPGKRAAIFSNCDRLEVFVDGKSLGALKPDSHYPGVKHPPFFVDLEMQGAGQPELRIDGFIGDRLAISKSFVSDSAMDKLAVELSDSEIKADGLDAARLALRVVDKHGQPRIFGKGEVKLTIDGPGVLIGDNPFVLTDCGGVGAVWIKSIEGEAGEIRITASHTTLGSKSVKLHTGA